MNWILKLIWFFIRNQAKAQVVSQARRRSLVFYLKALQGTRRLLVVGLLAYLFIQTMIMAAFGALITGVLLLEVDSNSKTLILFGAFSCLFLIPAIALIFAFSQRVWYQASGAKKMVDDILAKSNDKSAA